jgi:Amt family ammonium transporter
MRMEQVQKGSEVFFLLMGAILVFSMHGGFAFLEVGTVRHKNQVNALVKILVDFAISTSVYFAIGYALSYGVTFYVSAATLSEGQGFDLVRFFFLATFAAAVPAIISGGIAERTNFAPQCAATALLVGIAYPLIEGTFWNKNFGLQDSLFAGLLGLCGLWGGIACGIFGLHVFGGMGGVTFASQLVGSTLGAAFGFAAGTAIYWLVDEVFGLRLSPDEERQGADLSIHKIGSNPEDDVRMGRI